MIEYLSPYLGDIIITILGSVIAFIGTEFKRIYTKKINSEEKRQVVKTVVNAMNQMYKELDGPEKLENAINNITIILKQKGIEITEVEIRMLIEEACSMMKGDD